MSLHADGESSSCTNHSLQRESFRIWSHARFKARENRYLLTCLGKRGVQRTEKNFCKLNTAAKCIELFATIVLHKLQPYWPFLASSKQLSRRHRKRQWKEYIILHWVSTWGVWFYNGTWTAEILGKHYIIHFLKTYRLDKAQISLYRNLRNQTPSPNFKTSIPQK